MKRSAPGLAAVGLIFVAAYLALAQPGLCPCWLIADVKEVHPHPDGGAARPHDHGYLFEMFQTESAPAVPALVPPDLLLAALAAASAAWLIRGPLALPAAGWNESPRIPPPRRWAL